MDRFEDEVVGILRGTLGEAAGALGPSSPLLGVIPELDSMAVVAILTAIEERFGVSVDDDEVDGTTFASVASLTQFVRAKVT
jgi:acyl carrier protein